MKDIRILFTGAGRRVELLQAFRHAALVQNKALKIYGADKLSTAPALAYCDFSRLVCGMQESSYIPQLLDICKNDRIDLVIPTIDTDLQLLSNHKGKFEEIGTRVLVSSPEMIQICRDKRYTYQFFADCGLKAPLPADDYQKYDGGYPAFIKPRDGSSSMNTHKVVNFDELAFYAGQVQDYIIQPFIQGTEYTIDIFCDFDGNPVSIVPRERISVRAGEVLKTKICMDQTMIEESKALIRKFKPCGPLTVQLIRESGSGENYFIEINPRYGGGAPLSMKAGARTAETILQLLSGEKPDYMSQAIPDGAEYSRFDQSVCVCTGSGPESVRGVIFDLDDTLYPEDQYVQSGFQAVAAHLGNMLYANRLWDLFADGKPAISELLAEIGQKQKEAECIKVYREHTPSITLFPGVSELLRTLRNANIKVGIITDGRVNGQKKKIAALELDSMVDDVIITDELGGEQFRKPNDISFRIMQTRWKLPYAQIVYVGDNPAKDFQAPCQLGMKTVFFNNNAGLYSNKTCVPVFCSQSAGGIEQVCQCLFRMIGLH